MHRYATERENVFVLQLGWYREKPTRPFFRGGFFVFKKDDDL